MENKKIVLVILDKDRRKILYKIGGFDNKMTERLQNITVAYLS